MKVQAITRYVRISPMKVSEVTRERLYGMFLQIPVYQDMATWNIAYTKGRYLAKALGVFRGHMRRLRDMFRVSRYDLVYVFMWVTPLGTSLLEILIRRLARRLVFDVEDNVLIEQSPPGRSHPNGLLQLLKGPGKARYLIRSADHVITSSPFLSIRSTATRCE